MKLCSGILREASAVLLVSAVCFLKSPSISHKRQPAVYIVYLTVDSRDHSPVVWGTLHGVGLLSSSQQVPGDGCLSCPQSRASKNNAVVNNIILCCFDFLKVSLQGRFLKGIASTPLIISKRHSWVIWLVLDLMVVKVLREYK